MNYAITATNLPDNTKKCEEVIEINNLRKTFDEQEVLKNMSLRLFKGENLAVLGKSGSGKSVLIKYMIPIMEQSKYLVKISAH